MRFAVHFRAPNCCTTLPAPKSPLSQRPQARLIIHDCSDIRILLSHPAATVLLSIHPVSHLHFILDNVVLALIGIHPVSRPSCTRMSMESVLQFSRFAAMCLGPSNLDSQVFIVADISSLTLPYRPMGNANQPFFYPTPSPFHLYARSRENVSMHLSLFDDIFAERTSTRSQHLVPMQRMMLYPRYHLVMYLWRITN